MTTSFLSLIRFYLVMYFKLFKKFINFFVFIFKLPDNLSFIVNYFYVNKCQNTEFIKKRYRIAVEGIYDPLFFGLFGAVVHDLRKLTAINVDLLLVHSISNGIGTGITQFLQRSQLLSFLRCRQWCRAYSSFVDRVAYSSYSWLNPVEELKIFYRSRRIYAEIQKLPDFSTYVIDGLMVGDLIIDSYLRFRPSPKFDVTDSFLRKLISQTLRDIKKAERYFSTKKPLILLLSYAVYIEHGVPLRVALKLGIEVRCFPGPLNFGKRLTNTDYFHSSNCASYRHGFVRLTNKHSKLNNAEVALKRRFSGRIDTATSYMKASPYANTDVRMPDISGCVIIFLHDFFDSPHVYPDFIFVDFWAWITTTIDLLRASTIKFALKPHPNQTLETDAALKLLFLKYSDLNVLSSKLSNERLAKSGIICGVTVYGTVAHELAYFGIPSIACARHPHYQYDFCRTARSVAEYREFLLSPAVLPTSVDEMKRQALEFFFMHNLNISEEDLNLREKVASYFATFNSVSNNFEAIEALDQLRCEPAWNSLINELSLILDSNRDKL